jgi:hypothetical protein
MFKFLLIASQILLLSAWSSNFPKLQTYSTFQHITILYLLFQSLRMYLCIVHLVTASLSLPFATTK